MKPIHQKVWLATTLILISFSLLVAFHNDNEPVGTRNENATNHQTPHFDDTPFSPGSHHVVRPMRKSFSAQQRTTTGRTNYSSKNDESILLSVFALAKQNELDDLPELIFEDEDSSPGKVNSSTTIDLDKQVKVDPPMVEPPSMVKPPPFQVESQSQNKNQPQIQRALSSNPPKGQMAETRPATAQSLRIAPAVINSFLKKVRYANSLARRGAVSTAMEELKGSLRLFAEAVDQLQQTQDHSKAIHEGLIALQEVTDFANWGNDISLFAAGHDTEVLRDADLDKMTIHEARLAYLAFAEKQLLKGCATHPLTGEAFRSIGKVFLMMEDYTKHPKMTLPRAMLMLRLATVVNPKDAVAAKELGVLYARYNHLKSAKALLVKSLQVRSEAATWNALSQIHNSLGETGLAQSAMNEARLAASRNQKNGMVFWTNPQSFNQVGSMVDPPIMTAQKPMSGRAANANQINPNTRR